MTDLDIPEATGQLEDMTALGLMRTTSGKEMKAGTRENPRYSLLFKTYL